MNPAAQDDLLTDTGPPEGGANIDLGQLLLGAVSRHPLTILAFIVIGAIGGVFSAVIKPNAYTSTGKILVRAGARESLTPESGLQRDLGGARAPGVLDELELFQDPALYEQVAREVGPLELVKPYDPAADDSPEDHSFVASIHRFQSWWFRRNSPLDDPEFDPDSPELISAAAGMVRDNTQVTNAPYTQVLTIDISLSSPELAQRALQALIRAHDDRHRNIYKPERQLRFINEQLVEAKLQAFDIDTRRKVHEDHCGFMDVVAELADLGQRIRDLQSQNDGDHIRLRAIARELDYIDESLKSVPPTVESEIPPQRIQNPRVAELLAEQRQRNSDIQALSQSFAEGSEPYRSQEAFLRRRLQVVEEELKRTEPTLLVGTTVVQRNPNPRYEQFLVRRDELEQERAQLEVSLDARENSVVMMRDRLAKAANCSTEHSEFARDAAEVEQRIGELVAARERTQVLGAINEEERLSNLVVLQEASFSRQKTGPQRAKPSLIGLAMGCAVGFGLAIALQLLSAKIRSSSDIETYLKLRVLGVVPEQRAWRLAGREALPSKVNRG